MKNRESDLKGQGIGAIHAQKSVSSFSQGAVANIRKTGLDLGALIRIRLKASCHSMHEVVPV